MTQVRFTVLALVLAATAGLILGFGLDQVYLLHVGHDQSWCVYAASLVLHGVQLDGSQLVEVNPPFIIWFSALPVLLADLLHLGILDGFRLFFDITVVFSLLWTTALIRRLLHCSALSLWLFFITQSIVSLWLLNKNSLGQREQLLVLLVLPYLVLAAARTEGRSVGTLEASLVGLTAAAAVCLKPQHVLVVLLVEVLVLLTRRSLRTVWHPSVVAFAIGILAYLASVVVFGKTYLTDIVPKLRLVYSAMNLPYSLIVRIQAHVFLGLLICWIVFLLIYRRLRFNRFACVLGVAALGSAIAYIQQHKGWNYQVIPAAMFTVLFLGCMVIGMIERWFETHVPPGAPSRETTVKTIALSTACALCALPLGLHFGRHPDYYETEKRVAASFYQASPAGSAVSYISVNPWELPVFIEQNKVLGQRTNYFWLLPAIVYGQDPQQNKLSPGISAAQIAQLSSYQRLSMAEDLARWKPAVVIVDQCGPNLCDALKREHYDTVLNWFLLDPVFQREWQHYRLAEKSGDLESFHRVD
jgi:hypothetical protein